MPRSTDDSLFNDDARTDADQLLCDGLDFDPEAGLQYGRVRHFDRETGRWLNVEPVGYEADVNLYRYVGNAPCNDTDPTGLEYNRARHFDPTPGVFLDEDVE